MEERTEWRGQNEIVQIVAEEKINGRLVGAAEAVQNETGFSGKT